MAGCSSLTFAEIAKECRNNTGGIKDVWIIKSDDVTAIALTSETAENPETITGITLASGKTFSHWKFNAETANATSTGTFDNAAGTYEVQTDLALQFSKQDSIKRLQIKAAILEETRIIFRDNNNRIFMMGVDNPCYSSAATANTGTAMGDFNGYNITITDRCKNLPYEVVMTAEDLADLGIVL